MVRVCQLESCAKSFHTWNPLYKVPGPPETLPMPGSALSVPLPPGSAPGRLTPTTSCQAPLPTHFQAGLGNGGPWETGGREEGELLWLHLLCGSWLCPAPCALQSPSGRQRLPAIVHCRAVHLLSCPSSHSLGKPLVFGPLRWRTCRVLSSWLDLGPLWIAVTSGPVTQALGRSQSAGLAHGQLPLRQRPPSQARAEFGELQPHPGGAKDPGGPDS